MNVNGLLGPYAIRISWTENEHIKGRSWLLKP
jgi:hypothetical protein